MISRRTLIGSLAAGTGGLLLSGCNRINANPQLRSVLQSAEGLTMRAQRLIADRTALAREFDAADLSPVFRANGTRQPAGAAYEAHRMAGFADWRLVVDGLVARPQSLSLAQVRAMPRRTQITRHDCVEGWSAIGQWTGVPLKLLLDAAGLRSSARYLIFHCADRYGQADYYESIDLIDAFHPQTILAWGLNGQPLPVGNGAPLRLRVERQLGYKHAKYVQRIEAVDSLAGQGRGKGGYWEDYHDYAWYAGI
ncbi:MULTISPECIES: molybdopterin-binding protein [unclassified Sphingomonas]|uniref:molybdopterin-binding protein n=1 Tax=unclassified Sphingomonas TaxID=196159 RepID=UPI0006FA9B0B|nr:MULTISPECIES: molybdopterin-binding protein [unclassified Sphingomonas]KQX18449.1 molybdopterin-binding protein [Sphingomonas sp. Root1294]KQY72225.1 molybdopterin-binding protein [Sphingomonas sp. Root50]KRB94503.1 molybdopterin-binding protein [Sphingomonas sp. Root720]